MQALADREEGAACDQHDHSDRAARDGCELDEQEGGAPEHRRERERAHTATPLEQSADRHLGDDDT